VELKLNHKRTIFTLILLCYALVCTGQAFTFVFLNSKPDKIELPKEEVDRIMKGHMDNIYRLAKEGKLIVAGPFEGGGGIFILNTSSIDEAKQWLSTDPGVQANRWNVEILPYTPRIGSACAVGEPYEMVTYHFTRFTPQVTKVTTGNYPEILQRHNAYIKNQFSTTGNVIAEGTFGDHEGGILILKGELQKEIIEADPGVQEALLQFDIKKLWVAKGSFCEK
jgi:uncharacterized protein YciI